MLYGEIVWGGEKIEQLDPLVVGRLANDSGVGGNTPGAGSAIFPGPVYPGSAEITDGTNTWTDNGDGTLTGAPAGTGTIDYGAGVANLLGGVEAASPLLGVDLVATFEYNTRRNMLPSPVAPMFASLVNEGVAGEFEILVKDSPGVWRILPIVNAAAYEAIDLGLFPRSEIYVLATANARLNGRMANQI